MTTKLSWADQMFEALERQHALVTELSMLAERQAVLVEEARTEDLLGLLGERQRVVDGFTGAQDDVTRLSEATDADPESLDPEQRTRLRTLIDGIGERLAAVMRQDATDQDRLAARRDETKAAIAGIGTARAAQRAYIGRGTPAPRFSDRKG